MRSYMVYNHTVLYKAEVQLSIYPTIHVGLLKIRK